MRNPETRSGARGSAPSAPEPDARNSPPVRSQRQTARSLQELQTHACVGLRATAPRKSATPTAIPMNRRIAILALATVSLLSSAGTVEAQRRQRPSPPPRQQPPQRGQDPAQRTPRAGHSTGDPSGTDPSSHRSQSPFGPPSEERRAELLATYDADCDGRLNPERRKRWSVSTRTATGSSTRPSGRPPAPSARPTGRRSCWNDST